MKTADIQTGYLTNTSQMQFQSAISLATKCCGQVLSIPNLNLGHPVIISRVEDRL
jgi:hypothetical protein